MPFPKKLIEVALPLEEINKQSAREKSIRHGHPSTLHLWWARRPLAACRAVLFSSLVDDPSEYMPDEDSANAERQRLFRLIERLVDWDNITDEKLLAEARLEIARSVARNLNLPMPVGEAAIREFLATKAPPVLDPFAGGGSIPLEAQRLGLRAYASDLNPVAVLINKALIEIPPKFANRPPVHPVASPLVGDTGGTGTRPYATKRNQGRGTQLPLPSADSQWKGAAGLAEDVRYYGQWMRDEAEKRIGHLYPKVKLPQQYGGGEAKVIAWLWARTVKCPNPACGATMPLVRSFWLSTKKSRQAWVEPIVERNTVRFEVRTGEGQPPDGTVNRRGATCICCNTAVPFEYIRAEGKANRMDAQILATVADSEKGRAYIESSGNHAVIEAQLAMSAWKPDGEIPKKHRNFQTPGYGMKTWGDLFSPRQLLSLTVLSDLVAAARNEVFTHSVACALSDPNEYANAVATYLGMNVSKLANRCSTICFWDTGGEKIQQVFARQAIPMTWDYVEGNPFSESSGNFMGQLGYLLNVILMSPEQIPNGQADQRDAIEHSYVDGPVLISTDPPYYDNIVYADLSDFFYIWLRRSLKTIYPNLFNTLLTPKSQELIAAPARFEGDKFLAEQFFEEGLGKAFKQMSSEQDPAYPLTVFYAFKQSEDVNVDDDLDLQTASTGWETMLEGLIGAGFAVNGTWPMRTEFTVGLKVNANALASSIVLVCRPRPSDAPVATRREFIAALKRELPPALKKLQQGAIAPVDLAQAAIGPGMAVYSRYSQVLEADGSPMRVRAALALINQSLDEFFAEQEGEFDSDTRWALAWFEQYSHDEGPYGDAETLSKAKNTSTDGLVRAGILQARAGKVRLLRREELDANWTPETDERQSIWEATQYLIRALDTGGESAAASLLKRLGGVGETARDLAYRLYAICERKGWAQEALAYNMLAATWLRLVELAGRGEEVQEGLL
jgi:putative DNA methylase